MTSSDEPRRQNWLEIHGERQGEGTHGLTVDCPYRGACALSVCVGCKDFTTFEMDGLGWHTYVVCEKAEQDPSERQALIRRQLRDTRGELWTVIVYTRGRHDGTWDGWLEWLAADGATRYSGCETNERSRDAIVAWAEGLSAWSCRGFLIAREALPKGG